MIKIIAEIGVNHQGKEYTAVRLIHEAIKAGADAVKFQTYDCERLDPPGERREMLRGLQLSHSDHRTLKGVCRAHNMEFISTPFDVDSLRFLVDDLKVKTLKIASGNLDNIPLLEAAGESGCDVILSTGMATWEEVIRSQRWLKIPCLENLTFLHCTSAYPTPMEEVNLNAMVAMQDAFACPVGLSDHTEGITIPLAAAALRATVIEKHLTLDRAMTGPDHAASIEPDEFAAMVKGIRDIELAMGDGVKGIQDCERRAFEVANERRKWRDR